MILASLESEIASHAVAIILVSLAVMAFQIVFFPQYLAVEQPDSCTEINQNYPIWEDEKLADRDNREGHINWIAAKSENTVDYKSIGIDRINADPKAPSERDQNSTVTTRVPSCRTARRPTR